MPLNPLRPGLRDPRRLVPRGATYLQTALPCTRIPLVLAGQNARAYHSRRKSSAWAAVASAAGNVVTGAAKRAVNGPPDLPMHPLKLLAKELGTKFLAPSIKRLVASNTPQLDRVAKVLHAVGGQVRAATHRAPHVARHLALPKAPADPARAAVSIDQSISPAGILSDHNPSSSPARPSSSILAFQPDDHPVPGVNPAQRRLAEITETIHTASLLHDDVIDHSESRRGAPSANLQFGNKMAVLGGDFLLARASVALARLRHPEVVELLATVIANLVEGEFMQLKNTALDEAKPVWSEDALTYYLEKTYLKTASLISKSCRAAAILGDAELGTVDAAYLLREEPGPGVPACG